MLCRRCLLLQESQVFGAVPQPAVRCMPVNQIAATRLMELFHTSVQLHTRAPPTAMIRPYSTCSRGALSTESASSC